VSIISGCRDVSGAAIQSLGPDFKYKKDNFLVIYIYYGHTPKEFADYLQIHYSTVSKATATVALNETSYCRTWYLVGRPPEYGLSKKVAEELRDENRIFAYWNGS
jgi:hypothetical protein